jgi:hypothetical protein
LIALVTRARSTRLTFQRLIPSEKMRSQITLVQHRSRFRRHCSRFDRAHRVTMLRYLLLRWRYAGSRRGNANGCKVSQMTTPPSHGEAKRHPMVHGIRRWVIAWRSRSCAGLANASSRWRRSLTNDEKKHLSRVADLGCAVCRRMGFPGTPAEIHHKRAGTGAGRRSSHWETIPLCPEHHRGTTGLHGLGTKGFAKHWGFDEVDLLKETIELLTKTYPTKYDTPKKSD